MGGTCEGPPSSWYSLIMTLNQLKHMIDNLINKGYGDRELLMDTDPDDQFDIEFVECCEFDDGTPYIGVRTNDVYSARWSRDV